MDLSPIFGVGVLLAVLVLVVPALGVVGLLVVLALRRDGDDDGSRAPAIYACLVSFILCFTLLISVVTVASSLARLGHESTGLFDFGGSGGGGDDAEWRRIVQAVIVGVVAGGLLFLHARLLRWAVALDRLRAGGRIFRAYALVVCLVSVVLLLSSLVGGAYDVFRVVAPGVTDTAERADGLRDLVGTLVLAAGSFVLFRLHFDAAGLPALAAPEPAPPVPTPTDG